VTRQLDRRPAILEPQTPFEKEFPAVAGSVLHIVFNPSAAAGLRDALRQAGRDERVISFFDSLSFGPINPPDPELRSEWVQQN
jgi:Domain of unknown function (DUF1835)